MDELRKLVNNIKIRVLNKAIEENRAAKQTITLVSHEKVEDKEELFDAKNNITYDGSFKPKEDEQSILEEQGDGLQAADNPPEDLPIACKTEINPEPAIPAPIISDPTTPDP